MKNWFIIFFGLLLLSGCGNDEEEKSVTDISLPTSSYVEGNTTAEISLTMFSEGGLNSFTASYELEENTAKFGTDVEESSGTVDFAEGTGILDLTIVGDDGLELNESFYLKLTIDDLIKTFTITITDDDSPSEILSDDNGFYTPDHYTSMDLVWSDEFDGTALNEDDWTYELGDGCDKGICGWGNNELEIYTSDEENIRVVDGSLIIEATQNGQVFNSARIITQDKVEQRYGRIDIRARLPKGQGIWPALWMLGANIDDVSWPNCGEIDIMELVGHEPHIVHGTVHYDPGSGYRYISNGSALESGDFSDQFHVFSLVWDEGKIEWYVDNRQYKTFVQSDGEQYPFNNEFFFIFNVAVGGNWPGNPDATTVFPQQMEVDYIRLFR